MTASLRQPGRSAAAALFAALVGIAVWASAAPALAELRIDITQGTVEPLPIAVTQFVGNNNTAAGFGRDISKVITADLERSGLFRAVDPRAFIQSEIALQTLPRFGDWRVINAQALVT